MRTSILCAMALLKNGSVGKNRNFTLRNPRHRSVRSSCSQHRRQTTSIFSTETTNGSCDTEKMVRSCGNSRMTSPQMRSRLLLMKENTPSLLQQHLPFPPSLFHSKRLRICEEIMREL